MIYVLIVEIIVFIFLIWVSGKGLRSDKDIR